MLHCSLLWTSCLRFLTKSPAIPQQLYKTASRGLSAIAELLIDQRQRLSSFTALLRQWNCGHSAWYLASPFVPRDWSLARAPLLLSCGVRLCACHVRDLCRNGHSCYEMRIGNRTQAFEYYFQWPWSTSNPDFKVTIFWTSYNLTTVEDRAMLTTADYSKLYKGSVS